VLGFDEDRQVMLQSFATGRTLSTFAPDGSVIDALHRTGTALAQLHSLPLTALALADAPGRDACGFEAQMRGLMRPHPNELCERCPALSARIKRVLAELREWAASVASPVAPLHRDFHPRQIFIGDSVVEVVDWDLHGAGDPALDLASLHLHIEWRWPTIAAAGQAAFLRGYGAERVQAFAGRIALYRAFHHLRRACKAYRLRGLVAMSEIDANLRAADPAIACAHGTSGMPA
jgi:aminoglycoside phosphotransferase (APT) family kinase protein